MGFKVGYKITTNHNTSFIVDEYNSLIKGLCVQYIPGEFVKGEHGPLMLFNDYGKAYNFAEAYKVQVRSYRIWRVIYIPSKSKRQLIFSASGLSYLLRYNFSFKEFWEDKYTNEDKEEKLLYYDDRRWRLWDLPKGTVLASTVKLLNVVASFRG